MNTRVINSTGHLLGELSIDEFLAEYWQRKPLLIRQALPGFHSSVSANELAGLACEEDVESRLILEQHGSHPWQLQHGPFSEHELSRLPASHWSLLVQEANKHLQDVHEFMQQFRFLPDWRVDDVMISLAPEHGSVGPHVDRYDVFLVQAEGRRRWSIASGDFRQQPRIPDIELSILQQFEAQESWVLEPGDVLYLPPGVAHHGVAMELCQTWSVGFRAPAVADLAAYMAEQLEAQEDRYTDGLLPDSRNHPAEISIDNLDQARQLLDQFNTPEQIAPWFGRLVTENRAGLQPQPADPPYAGRDLLPALQRHAHCLRSRYSRFAYHAPLDQSTWLFTDGLAFALGPYQEALARAICNPPLIDCQTLLAAGRQSDDLLNLLSGLFNAGCLCFEVEH